jgi:hypothetical protein
MLNAKHYEGGNDQVLTLSYENGDIYIGRAGKNAIRREIGILFELAKNRVYVGEFNNGQKQGKGRYETLLTRDWTYQGEFLAN